MGILGVKKAGEKAELQVQMLPVDKLMVSPKNPRTTVEENFAGLKESIKNDADFLQKRPILVNFVNGLYVIYGGTQRYKACCELGFKEVPCLVGKNLDHATIDFRMLADNSHAGAWNETILFENFAAEIEDMAYAFKDHPIKAATNHGSAGAKPISKKLTFETKEELDDFYKLLNYLQEKYPMYTVAKRLTMFLGEHAEG